jgi:mono/diheme cytochrome c family protein
MTQIASTVTKARYVTLGAAGALIVATTAAAIAVFAGVYAGIYNVAADIPHAQPVFWLLQTARERSVALRAADIVVPDNLDEADRVTAGAGQYADMCAGCHLAPGMKRTEMSRGLYPRAPELRRGSDMTAAEEFWVIKHGIKATGMPAWGVTHSDDMLWDVVAFLRKLPDLSAEEYQALVKHAPSHDDIMQEMDADGDHTGDAH